MSETERSFPPTPETEKPGADTDREVLVCVLASLTENEKREFRAVVERLKESVRT